MRNRQILRGHAGVALEPGPRQSADWRGRSPPLGRAKGAKGMDIARIGILSVLALAPALFGCGQDAPPPSAPLSPAPEVCQQAARNLGFTVLGGGELEPQPDGSAAYPILVQCRNDGAGGVTLG